jgi:plasmid maintenance system antidote protein VapI
MLTEAAIGIPADLLLRMQARHDKWKTEQKPGFMEKLKSIQKFAAVL